ncbi:MAG: hypothetical protein SF339_03435 [Blastocatellia bacterium]|nr:hypothetical protein [Blastocatellia bacterium]
MLRIILGVIAGFFGWVIGWFGSEKALSAIWPEWFGVQQRAFQAAIENDGQFAPDTRFLLTQILCAAIVSVMSGFLAALVAGEAQRAPLILGILLLALGLMKAVLSWRHVPVWYHILFTAILVLMTIMGGKLKTTA